MPMIDGGYFAKRVTSRPKELNAPGVQEICSVSNCISPAPEGWIGHWRHNELGWFNTIADALSVVPEPERPHYRVFAYRLEPFVFRQGTRVEIAVPSDVHPHPIGPDFVERGFDAANKSMPTVLGVECSPLSCNYLATELTTNAFCLFPTYEAAVAGARSFSIDEPEPGDYYIIQVLELAFTAGVSREDGANAPRHGRWSTSQRAHRACMRMVHVRSCA
jgi:hypothetical protein